MQGPAPSDALPSVHQARSVRLTVAALRRATSLRVWGGHGCGAPCDFCRVVVAPADVEYEVEASLDGKSLVLHFHRNCHDAWQAGQTAASDSDQRDGPQGGPSSDAA